ncbi:hypothetical protein CO134_03010 [Candidatus Kuenenbacteria bacterium CG_4_9_14_3_um_filter_39_14]|uniref:Uncharacterized protein n=6 Tax=Candidatus Kueneniibacteriota TaxID=1752740 RepID=A0A2M7ILS5_9BACT|nr:hypothetical protein [Candidatus Kuenenbacteria bacterium]OIP56690.1 MAG: hypothetical protein AUK13_00405 [Candidatus Kuenenbacteria bacterium CG2_30_39_24]PIP28692.1 MAG: hypothetical protein COX28_03310 [Candidatus Kuenenbacteria bacterium CG23_combo_of_CG06-09_8_20_14_all_39_39]PIR80519.1 MAG: hypothetical protein COU24_03595 [Candidatus Kuenenbacteria bacterium CG10_big_fil_rev_8_21_14_0_10_39_14]PIW95730.1 MAG: hypothetical protein COZ84_01905 [Candidatus Kuenenbacteria bacterium CG_4_
MSFFDFLFGTGSQASKRNVTFADKSKLTRQDMIDLVWNMQSLNSQQKQVVKEELFKYLDDGGVTLFEYREAIRKLAERRVELGLSEIDIKNLKSVL